MERGRNALPLAGRIGLQMRASSFGFRVSSFRFRVSLSGASVHLCPLLSEITQPMLGGICNLVKRSHSLSRLREATANNSAASCFRNEPPAQRNNARGARRNLQFRRPYSVIS